MLASHSWGCEPSSQPPTKPSSNHYSSFFTRYHPPSFLKTNPPEFSAPFLVVDTHLVFALPLPMAALFPALLLLLAAFHSQVVNAHSVSQLKLRSKILQESIINEINGHPHAGWEAAKNDKFSDYTVGEFKYILGAIPTPESVKKHIPAVTHPRSLKLPTQFDARTAWPQCSGIGRIPDQGHCGSCWAFGAVESPSDRFCIHFGMNISLSVNDLLACCGYKCGAGCNGGYPISAWRYFVSSGVVTEACNPYFDATGCSHPGCEPQYATPTCERKCKDENQTWGKSKHFSVSAYRVNSDPHDIMAEIYKNGPVEVSFTVYEDFAHYKSGVYKHVTGSVLGGHAVKLMGWGTSESGEHYWLVANQWNKGWGEEGYFKIKRGTNECGIEDDVVGGLPSSKNLSEKLIRLPEGGDSAPDASA